MKRLLTVLFIVFIQLLNTDIAFAFMANALSDIGAGRPEGEDFLEKQQVQEWLEPLEIADLLLFSAHADDEHLFFAGVLPYCVAYGIKAQVVYMTNHDDNPIRNTERLEGLWAVGVRNFPVVSLFPDLYAESLNGAIKAYQKRGFVEDDFIDFCVANIRRFKPQVVVGHDIDGEYGHGTHMLSAICLQKALELTADSSYHSVSAEEFGLWDTPKTYLHLWPEREITINIDEPLEFFDFKSAFQVSQYGFSFHKSQHWMSFYKWLNGTATAPISNSSEIVKYPPGKFGLYRTLVGEDSESAADFFEHVLLHKDMLKIAAEIADHVAEEEKSSYLPSQDRQAGKAGFEDENLQEKNFLNDTSLNNIKIEELLAENIKKPLQIRAIFGIVLLAALIMLLTVKLRGKHHGPN